MQLSDTEWTVMNFIWRSQPTEAGEVIEELGVDNAWTDATVKTMLHRLVKKGALSTEAVGKKFRYRAAVKKQDCIRLAGRSFLQRVFGGNAAPALLHFVKESKLTDAELAEIRELLDAKLASKHIKKKGSRE